MTPPLSPEQQSRLDELKSEARDDALDSHQRLRLACLQIVGRLGVRCDPRAAAEDLFAYVIHGAQSAHRDDHDSPAGEAA